MHVKILINGRLQISLPNVERSQIVIADSGDGKYEPNSKRFEDGRKDAIEVDTTFLSVAVGNEASLSLNLSIEPSALRLIANTKWQCIILAVAGTEAIGTRSQVLSATRPESSLLIASRHCSA